MTTLRLTVWEVSPPEVAHQLPNPQMSRFLLRWTPLSKEPSLSFSSSLSLRLRLRKSPLKKLKNHHKKKRKKMKTWK
jgi:hypothetical protein